MPCSSIRAAVICSASASGASTPASPGCAHPFDHGGVHLFGSLDLTAVPDQLPLRRAAKLPEDSSRLAVLNEGGRYRGVTFSIPNITVDWILRLTSDGITKSFQNSALANTIRPE